MNSAESERPLALVIDDDSAVLQEVTTVLAEANFACRCCTSAAEAIAAAATQLPQLIICNVNLHGESGFDTCKRIRRQAGGSAVPVMLLSGLQLPDVIRRSAAGGGVYCLRKPFDRHVLTELIDQALAVPEV